MVKLSNFDNYMKNRSSLTQRFQKKVESSNNNGFASEEGFWQPTPDKAGNGWAVIRFLPPGGDEQDYYVSYYSYSFKGPGGWYIEKSRRTLGRDEPDPVAEFVQPLWDSNNQEEARKFSRKQNLIANILVIDDPEHPENNGKVFLFRYGPQIQKKINDAMQKIVPTDEPFDAFDLLEGAPFNLIVGKKDKFRTYENSKFGKVGPISSKKEEMARILEQCKPIQSFVAPESFKSYDELKKRFERVMGGNLKAAASAPKMEPKASKKEVEPDIGEESESLDDIINGLNME